MPDASGRYAMDERHLYDAPECENCGSSNTRVGWSDATSIDDAPGERWAVPASYRCLDCRGLPQ